MLKPLLFIGALLLSIGISGTIGYRQGQHEVFSSRTPIESGDFVLTVETEGIYSIEISDIANAGVSLEPHQWRPENLSLSSNGDLVPYYWFNNQIIFYGQSTDNIYTKKRPYLLSIGENLESLKMDMVSVQPSSEPSQSASIVSKQLTLEENSEYISTAYSPNSLHTWFWHTIHVQGEYSFDFELGPITDGSGTVRMGFFGTSEDAQIDGDHDLAWQINTQEQAPIVWDGVTYHIVENELAPGTLQTGLNSIHLDNTAVGAAFVDIMQFDWFKLQYSAPAVIGSESAYSFYTQEESNTIENSWPNSLLLDVTEPDRPILLNNSVQIEDQLAFQYMPDKHIFAANTDQLKKPADLHFVEDTVLLDRNTQADFIIITAPAFEPILMPLVEARRSQGLTVVVANTTEIYHQFGDGWATPDSIQAFLQYAAQEWETPAPKYVLLVGTSIYDYRENLGSYPHQVPAPLVPVVHSGETVSDARLADVDNDQKPDLAIGRWPVNSTADVENLVARTIAYEQGRAAAELLFTADGSSSEFTGLSDRIITNSNTPETNINKLYGASFTDVTEAWNEGSWLVSYVGHGSINLWGQDQVFTRDAVSQLTKNDFSPPIVLQFTCLTGYFAHPTQRSISELMLTHQSGPVLLVAATSLTYSTDQQKFAESLLSSLQSSEEVRIGDAFQEAKIHLDVSQQGTREVSDTFGLLGDPSALIIRPEINE